MSSETTNRPVLAAVGNPAHTEQLVRTAGDLARANDGAVEIVSVVVKPYESPFSVYSDETILEQYAGRSQQLIDDAVAVAPADVTVEASLVVSHSVADGLLAAVDETDARALVIGWHQRDSRTDALLGTAVDRVLERAPCDVYVERIGHEANGVDSILVPVGGGPHVRPAVEVAKAIAARNDATVGLCSVDDETTPAAARGYVDDALALLESAPGPPVRTESSVLQGENVVETLLERADEHDVLVFGTTRQGALQRRLVGSIPQTVTRRADRTVLLARDGESVGRSPLERVRQFWPVS
ncbi:universal stress protein [Natronolimnohabitans innermongolicus]|uniref:UspA domain-containing protein n=1 Tax=Natronolimnohabitans innermongolicus JCM 12255 TaxID=1227499 RepID=L9WP03_9EURY|nr:universal stress protein [Natronolimnohabitans innermongolicus]ELY51194.1 UspA domain-containing protein [Natronolimnohabitans innermongolicus JCM 12255]